MTLRNFLALVRLALLPPIIIFMDRKPIWAFLLFFVVLFLHFFYHKINRTKADSFLTPFSLKIIVTVLLFVYILKRDFWLIPFSLFILRDLIVALIRWRASVEDILIKDLFLSRSLVIMQSVLVFTLLLRTVNPFPVHKFVIFFTSLSLVIALASILQSSFVYVRGVRARIKGRKMSNEPMIILANRQSRGFKDRYRRHLLRRFAKRRHAEIIYLPKDENLFQEIPDLVKKYKHIIIAGGDGTFEAALNNPFFQSKILGFFPLGAGNAYYSYFYKGKRFEYLRNRFPFREILLDIVEIESDHGKRQTTFFGLGIDATVMHLARKERSQHGFLDYFIAGTKAALTAPASYDIQCDIDGQKYFWKNLINFNLGKIPYYGFGIRSLFGSITPHDQIIHGTACINSHSPFFNKAIRLWALIMGMFGFLKPPLFAIEGRDIRISSTKPFPLQAGGEYLGKTFHLNVKVKRQQKVLLI